MPSLPLLSRWHERWAGSLRNRLLALSLAPLLLVFPLVLGVLVAMGGESFDRLLATNALGKVDGVRNYLEHISEQAGEHLKQLSTSESMTRLLTQHAAGTGNGKDLGQLLQAQADAGQYDFLVIAGHDGRLIASSAEFGAGQVLPSTFVTRQARAGVRYDLVVIDAYERVYVPEHLMSREFIEEVKSLLAPGGVVASNTFARGPLAPYEAATYQSVFADTRVVDMSMGNRIILAGRDGLPPAATIRDSASKLEGRFHEIGIFVRELESHPQPKVEGYRPLTDQYAPANLLFGE